MHTIFSDIRGSFEISVFGIARANCTCSLLHLLRIASTGSVRSSSVSNCQKEQH